MALRDRVFGTKRGYETLRRLIKADRMMESLVEEYFRPVVGQSVLDLGCGPGDLARFLPKGVRYLGVDHNPAYLEVSDLAGPQDSPVFMNADLTDLDRLDIGRFDIAVAVGVLHHLDDDLTRSVVATVRERLPPGGRLITVDPAFAPNQASITRVLLALDRGRYVRHPSDYERLVRSGFDDARVHVRHDLLPIPYTHCIIEATA